MKISASIMCADLFHLERDVLALKQAKADYLHLDVMDGQFVDNITLGLDFCSRIAGYGIPRDVHFLAQYPDRYVDALHLGPGDICQMHMESQSDLPVMAARVHRNGARMGVVLNPETPVEALAPYLCHIDLVNLMMIRPGFAGRPIESGMIQKILYCRQWLYQQGREDVLIEVDGHVCAENAGEMVANGADILVAGTSVVFRSDVTIPQGMENLRRAVQEWALPRLSKGE